MASFNKENYTYLSIAQPRSQGLGTTLSIANSGQQAGWWQDLRPYHVIPVCYSGNVSFILQDDHVDSVIC